MAAEFRDLYYQYVSKICQLPGELFGSIADVFDEVLLGLPTGMLMEVIERVYPVEIKLLRDT
jgi:hypothetical protein